MEQQTNLTENAEINLEQLIDNILNTNLTLWEQQTVTITVLINDNPYSLDISANFYEEEKAIYLTLKLSTINTINKNKFLRKICWAHNKSRNSREVSYSSPDHTIFLYPSDDKYDLEDIKSEITTQEDVCEFVKTLLMNSSDISLFVDNCYLLLTQHSAS